MKRIDNRPSHPDCERCKVIPRDYYRAKFHERERAVTALYVSLAWIAAALANNLPAILSVFDRR